MRYVSTRGKANPLGFKDILLEGLASDGGLYMPESYPELDLEMLRGCGYIDVASFVLSRYAPDIPFEDLRSILEKTYTAEVFGSPEITPLFWIEPGLGLLRLSKGPTLAFKDVPLQLLGNLMEYVLQEKGDELNVLGATSGDTGSAAAYALRGKQGLRLFMLSPFGRMSRFQQQQMYTLNEPNIFNLVVNGTFDDCQAVVKEVNADAEFKKKYKLGAINSINWARIAAQVVYWVYAYVHSHKSSNQRVMFSVPSGNFGNAMSAYIAKKMGLPVDIVIATNENDVLHEFFVTGTYRVRKGGDVKVTSSPSMDIASASNFERFIFDLVREDAPDLVSDLWGELKEKGEFNASFLMASLTSEIRSGKATEAEVLQTIRDIHKLGVTIDPHTAVAMHVGLQHRKPRTPLIVAETASPAKFEDTIYEAIGSRPVIPEEYRKLADLPQHTTRIDPDAAAVKAFIAAHV